VRHSRNRGEDAGQSGCCTNGLLLLAAPGQDAAGIVTSEHKAFHMHKGPGMVRDVFRTRNMRSLSGQIGIAHCRYPTRGFRLQRR